MEQQVWDPEDLLAYLYSQPSAQRMLLYIRDKLAATLLQTASELRIDPDEVHDILEALEQRGLVDVDPTSSSGPYTGVYAPTTAGIRIAGTIRSLKRS